MMSNLRAHRLHCLGFVGLVSWLVAATSVTAAPVGTLPDAHASADCRACHTGTAAASAAAGRPVAAQCRSCHGERPTAAGTLATWFHRDTDRPCQDCHRFHHPDVVATGLGELSLTGLHDVDRAHCQACHGEGLDLAQLAEAHRTAARLYHGDAASLARLAPSQGCLACHGRDSGSTWPQLAASGPSFDAHRSHPVGVSLRRGSAPVGVRLRADVDPRLRLFDGRVECATCHRLTAATLNRLVAFERPRDLCLACHAMQAGDDEAPAAVASAGF